MMRRRLAMCAVLFGALVSPEVAEACSCGGPSLPSSSYRWADVVFLGRFIEAERARPVVTANPVTVEPPPGLDGVQMVTIVPTLGFSSVTFDVLRAFRGTVGSRVSMGADSSTCGHGFQVGEEWLIFAHVVNGRLETNKCTSTKLRSDATQDLRYLEGVVQGRRQGIAYGHALKRVESAGTNPPVGPARAVDVNFPTRVIAVGAGGRFEAPTDFYGAYQLVLPEGDFDVSLVDGKGTTLTKQKVRIGNGVELNVNLIVE